MKLCIAGCHELFDEKMSDMLVTYACNKLNFHGPEFTDSVIDGFPHTEITQVVSGRARGIDQAGERWACCQWIPIAPFPADWENYGKAAGPYRNSQMANYADALLVIWDGKSPGSANMLEQMKKQKKPIYQLVVNGPSIYTY